MSAVQSLREFVNERLTAAAEEIFGVVERTIFKYEEEIDRQRRLLKILPTIKLHRIQLPQQHVCKEEEDLAEQQHCIQENNSCLDQEDPEPPQIKEEQEELCSSEEQLVLKQETDDFMLTPTCMENHHSEDQTLNLTINDTQNPVEEKPQGQFQLQHYEASEVGILNTNSDHQLLSHNSPLAESQDQKVGTYGESGSTHAEPELNQSENAEPELNQPDKTIRGQSHNVNSTTLSVFHKFKCEICEKGFQYNSKLQRHMRVHTGERTYSCKICGKDFKHQSNLSVHFKTHTGEKPYSCKVCGKDFRHQCELVVHLRIHSGEKPYSCKICGKRFRINRDLTVHLGVHTGEKPYSCKICGKNFRRRCKLTLHTRIHTGEKPYPCKTCRKRFSDFSAMTRHTRIHTR
ncbi:zinc finger protein 28 homolog [Eleginops maclovinus]|uniref:zinc finger protein 28 homolog n=1 Tax=Eleginops maclovinus TaxID=56733 RepID=UPI0030801A01